MDISDACSLSAPELAERRRAFSALPLVDDTGGRVRYRDEPGVEDALRDLIRLESECCPGVRFELTREEGMVVMTVSA